MISTKYYIHVLAMALALIIINPIITFKLISLIPIKPKKKAKSISEELKREVK